MASFGAAIATMAGPVVKRALAALGIGVVSYSAVTGAVNSLISASASAFGGLGAIPAAFIAMAGLTQAFSIVAGGLTASVAFSALKRFQIL